MQVAVLCGKNCGLFAAILLKKSNFFACQWWQHSVKKIKPLYINAESDKQPVAQSLAPGDVFDLLFVRFPQSSMNGR
jgi:hypothetical protein